MSGRCVFTLWVVGGAINEKERSDEGAGLGAGSQKVMSVIGLVEFNLLIKFKCRLKY